MVDRFPIQTSIAVDFSASPEEVRNEVLDEAAGVSGQVQQLRAEAEGLYAQASALIQEIYSYTASPIPDVTFNVETVGHAPFVLGAEPALPAGLYRGQAIEYAELGALPTISIDPFTSSTFSAPSADAVPFPVFNGIDDIGDAPEGPAEINLNITPPPDLTLDLQALPEVGAPPVFGGSTIPSDLEFPDIQPFPPCDVEFPPLDGFNAYESVVGNTFARSEYAYRILPLAIQASEAMVCGNFIIDLDALEAGNLDNANRAADKYDRRVSTIWSRRGFEVNEEKRDHIDRTRARVQAETATDFAAAEERWRMRLMPVALRLATAAHGAMVEIIGELYDLDFAVLETEANGLRALYALAAARLNIQLAEIEARVAEYRGLVAQVRAGADQYRAVVARAESTGRLNQSLARGYAAGQQARESEGDVFIADVRANETVLQAYESQIRALEAEGRALRARVIQYEGDVSEWEGRFNSARADYREIRARNRAVIAQNRTSAAQMEADSTASAAIADRAAASATEASALAELLRSEIVQREGEYEETNFANTAEALQYGIGVADYRADAAQYAARIANDLQVYANTGRQNAAVAGTYRDISNNAVRAAELTQRNRIELANIYDSLYDAAGRADAARISGRLSRFRASYGLAASGDLSYDSDISRSVSYNDQITNDQSNTRNTIYNEATE